MFRADPVLLKRMQNDESYIAGVEMFNEAITNIGSEAMARLEAVVLANLEESVPDPALREKLRPTYRGGLQKRLIYSPDYYRAIQHPQTELVTESILHIEPRGVRTADGRLHEFDVLALATGFRADQFMRPMQVTGRGGVLLNDSWKARPTAYMAISIPDFPNLFMLNGPTGPVGNFSLIEIAEQQWVYIAQLIEQVAAGHRRDICATHEAMAAYEMARIAAAKTTVFGSGCRSWYLDSDGIPLTWPWSRARFMQEMRSPRLEAYG